MLLINKVATAGRVQLNLTGQLHVPGCDRLVDVVRESLGRRGLRVVLNLQEVDGLDAAGLGVLATVRTLVDASGGRLTLLNPDRRIIALLAVVGFDAAFDISSGVELKTNRLKKDDAVVSMVP